MDHEKRNFVLSELYGLSAVTLAYLRSNCNSKTLEADFELVERTLLVQECIQNNFRILHFELAIIQLMVEYSQLRELVISNRISDRSHCDGARSMDLIDTTFVMPSDGVVTEFIFYPRRSATLYGTVWRCLNAEKAVDGFSNSIPSRRPRYKLIALVKFGTKTKLSCHVENRRVLKDNEEIPVQKGDFIGIRWDHQSSIPSNIGGVIANQVHWLYPTETPQIGEERTFQVGDQRDYAYGFKAQY